MTLGEAEIAIASVGAVVLIATFFVTVELGRRSIDNLRAQTVHLQRSVEDSAYQAVIAKEIDLTSMLAADACLGEIYDATAVFPWRITDPDERRKRWYCVSRLEIFELVFLHFHRGAISQDVWQGWEDYIVSTIQIPLFKDVWDKLQSFYHPAFVQVVNGAIQKRQAESNGRLPTT